MKSGFICRVDNDCCRKIAEADTDGDICLISSALTNIHIILIELDKALSVVKNISNASKTVDFPMSFLPTNAVKSSK